jgi:TetR/AcrR family transcriptional repressor of mexJK operon
MTTSESCQIASVPVAKARSAGRPRLDSLAGRRRELLDTARMLFMARGFHEVSLAHIARNARVALRTIYLQYESKEGLLRQLIREESAMHRAELDALRLDGMPFQAQLECLALHLADRICRRDLLTMYAIVVATRNPGLFEAFDEAGPAQIGGVLIRILEAGPPAHRPRDVDDAGVLCEHFLACVAGGRLEAARPSVAAAERARRGLALFLRALPGRE